MLKQSQNKKKYSIITVYKDMETVLFPFLSQYISNYEFFSALFISFYIYFFNSSRGLLTLSLVT